MFSVTGSDTSGKSTVKKDGVSLVSVVQIVVSSTAIITTGAAMWSVVPPVEGRCLAVSVPMYMLKFR
jgi:hypothetical protein